MQIPFLLICASLHAFPKLAHAHCWWKIQNRIISMETFAGVAPFYCDGKSVSNFQNCCTEGDTCEEGSICHFMHQSYQGSGYYIAGCSDPTYMDPICSPQCSKLLLHGVKQADSSILT